MVIRAVSSVGEWEALASTTFVPVRIESPVETFAGTMDHRGDAECGVTAIRSGAGRVVRSAEHLSSSPDDVALFSVQVRGSSRVEQDGRQARLAAGDGVLYLTRREYELTFPEPAELAILQVPAERLGLDAGSLAALAARPLRIRHDAALRTFTRVVRSLVSERPVIPETDQALRVATEMLGSVFRHHRAAPNRARSHAALFASFDRIVHERLDDPRLDVSALASAERVSARTVHHVFAERGTTPAAYIRDVRIGRAQRLLAATSLPLADIAVRCGSSDASVFSRTFRAVTGLTPSEYRAGATSPG